MLSLGAADRRGPVGEVEMQGAAAGELERIRNLDVDLQISPSDTMYAEGFLAHYVYVGQTVLLMLMGALTVRAGFPGGDRPLADLLDFGCGHGRIARHLRAGFPAARVYVTDRDRAGVEWCVNRLGCLPAPERLAEPIFDLVWLGSVFTHLPQREARALLMQLLSLVRAGGLIGFTSQGRFSAETVKQDRTASERGPSWVRYNLPDDQVDRLLAGYSETGYGYVDYPGQQDYGVSIVDPRWYADIVFGNPEFTQILFSERGIDNHQDVSFFLRVPILDPRKGPLYAP
jgi:SAM-dependent methyltransferase